MGQYHYPKGYIKLIFPYISHKHELVVNHDTTIHTIYSQIFLYTLLIMCTHTPIF